MFGKKLLNQMICGGSIICALSWGSYGQGVSGANAQKTESVGQSLREFVSAVVPFVCDWCGASVSKPPDQWRSNGGGTDDLGRNWQDVTLMFKCPGCGVQSRIERRRYRLSEMYVDAPGDGTGPTSAGPPPQVMSATNMALPPLPSPGLPPAPPGMKVRAMTTGEILMEADPGVVLTLTPTNGTFCMVTWTASAPQPGGTGGGTTGAENYIGPAYILEGIGISDGQGAFIQCSHDLQSWFAFPSADFQLTLVRTNAAAVIRPDGTTGQYFRGLLGTISQ